MPVQNRHIIGHWLLKGQGHSSSGKFWAAHDAGRRARCLFAGHSVSLCAVCVREGTALVAEYTVFHENIVIFHICRATEHFNCGGGRAWAACKRHASSLDDHTQRLQQESQKQTDGAGWHLCAANQKFSWLRSPMPTRAGWKALLRVHRSAEQELHPETSEVLYHRQR